MNDIRRITLMMRAGDMARADIALTDERTYYRFATDSSIEDGQIAAVDNFEIQMAEVIGAYPARDGETPLDPDMRFQLFVNNRLEGAAPSEQSLRRVVDICSAWAPEFAFLRGFLK